MTKQELKHLLEKDLSRFGGKKPGLRDYFLRNEVYFIWQYIVHMRLVEYSQNKKYLGKLRFFWHMYLLKRLQFKLHIVIYPGTVGAGFRLFHLGGYTHIGPNVKIGENCTIVGGVVFGNKGITPTDNPVSVGDNVYFGIESKIIGSISIGDNVVVGANAVVTKDIPSNTVVGGVPAKIIKENHPIRK